MSSTEELLSRWQAEGLVGLRDSVVETTSPQRAQLAILAIEHGADPSSAGKLLSWQEFEHISAIAFAREGYKTFRNLRFKQGGRKWEIDVIGYKRPLLVCADCKHWRGGLHHSALRRTALEQAARASALLQAREVLNKGLEHEKQFTIIPIVLSLTLSDVDYIARIPIVPLFKLHAFLDQLPLHVDSLFCLSGFNENSETEAPKTADPRCRKSEKAFKAGNEKGHNLDEFM
jgi:hypothetical protein